MTITTLAHTRATLTMALTHSSNPAILRLPEKERTVEGLARAYLPRSVEVCCCAGEPAERRDMLIMLADRNALGIMATRTLDLTDPGTAHALLVVLALALGGDPGPEGLGVMWTADQDLGWMLSAGRLRWVLPVSWRTETDPLYVAAADELQRVVLPNLHSRRVLNNFSTEVLALAVQYVLGVNRG